MHELDILKQECRVFVKRGVESSIGKVNVLLQAYITQVPLRSFTLISDMSYISQKYVLLSIATERSELFATVPDVSLGPCLKSL